MTIVLIAVGVVAIVLLCWTTGTLWMMREDHRRLIDLVRRPAIAGTMSAVKTCDACGAWLPDEAVRRHDGAWRCSAHKVD